MGAGSMAEFIIGKDIFKEPGDLYIVTVNTIGVMGAGVAKAFAERHHDLFLKYKHDCKMKIITIGHPALYEGTDGKRYLMFPTKENWRNPSTYDYVGLGLQWLVDNIGEDEDQINPKWTIIVPPLGCGNGGLDFDIVSEMIEEASGKIPNKMIVVYPPWMSGKQ
jgi:hypothetical protein